MAASCSCFVPFLLLLLASASALTTTERRGNNGTRRPAFSSEEELRGFRSITARLARLRDASVKTIQARIYASFLFFFFPRGRRLQMR